MKKVKTIKGVPKYSVGTNGITPNLTLSKPLYSFDPNQLGGTTAPSGFSFNENWADMTTNQKMGAVSGAVGGAASLYNMAASGQKPTVGTALSGMATGALAGAAFGPIGAGAGAFMGLLAGTAGSKYHVNRDAITTTSDVSESVEGGGWLSWFGPSKGSQIRKATGIQNSKVAYEQTANARVDYANDPRNQPVTVSAKDGGVISKKIKITNTIPEELVHAKVSKGELYYDPYNKTLSRVPGSPNKPNIDDNVDAFLAKGGMVVTNNNKQPLIDGKTQAIALAPMVDKPNKNMSKGTIEARDRIIKKVTRLNELSKTENNKPNNIVYAKDGDPDVGNVISANDLNWYNDIYLNKNTDPSSNKYNDWFYSTLAMIDSGNFEEYNKLLNMYADLGFTDTKPGSKIKKSDAVETYQGMFDNMTDINAIIANLYDTGRLKGRGGSTDKREVWRDGLPGSATWLRHLGKNVDEKTLAEMNADLNKRGVEAYINSKNGMVNYRHYISHPEFGISKKQVDEAVFGTPNFPKPKPGSIVTPPPGDEKRSSKKGINFSWAENILDRIPLLAAYLNKPKYHIEEPQTWIPKYRPVAVDINPQRRAIDDSMAIARYNQAHINPNTGAGMAYGLQAANNRAKQLADVYSYLTNAQNELIGQNVGIYNQWAPQTAAARYQAIADTRANEAAADAQRDMNIRDAISYVRDEQIKPFLKQYLSSGAYNKSIKKLS